MPQTLTLYTDFVCPFCFIAEQATVSRLLKTYDLEIDWRGYQLHPETPEGGMDLSAMFGAARLPAMREHMLGFAKGFGITDMLAGAEIDRIAYARERELSQRLAA